MQALALSHQAGLPRRWGRVLDPPDHESGVSKRFGDVSYIPGDSFFWLLIFECLESGKQHRVEPRMLDPSAETAGGGEAGGAGEGASVSKHNIVKIPSHSGPLGW